MSNPIWTASNLKSEFTTYDKIAWHAVDLRRLGKGGRFFARARNILKSEDKIQEFLKILGIKPDVSAEDIMKVIEHNFSAKAKDSRFYHAHTPHGVLYVAESPETAIAEMAYYLWLEFYQWSNNLQNAKNPAHYLVFSLHIKTGQLIDLLRPIFSTYAEICLHKTESAAARDFADCVRQAGGEAIRYPSLRDKDSGTNVAILLRTVIMLSHKPERQYWQLKIKDNIIFIECQSPYKKHQIPIRNLA
ncbi:MAG: RES family NAD+ phosphorylase [Candidatus Symbiobacter sp.]|nr:RES family NAD+ phosphorylase [Candidatus Symbiobacter sp.]